MKNAKFIPRHMGLALVAAARPSLHRFADIIPASQIVMFAIFLFLFSCSAFAQSPQDIRAQVKLVEARALLDQKHIKEAEHAVLQLLENHPDSADAHFLLGLILFREIQAESAPGDAYNEPAVSQRKRREEKARASLAEYTEGSKYARPSAFDLKIVALNYVLFGDYTDADRWLTLSLKWNPQDSEAWYYLGRAKYNLNRFEEAVQAFRQCLKLDLRNVKAEDNLGLAYAGLNRVDDATIAFRTAIQWQEGMADKDAGPFIDLGTVLMDRNRVDEALPILFQAVTVDPEQSKSHELLGKAYSLLNQLPKAQAELERAVALASQTPHLHYMLGQVYRKQGLVEKAKQEFDRMSQLTKNAPSGPESEP